MKVYRQNNKWPKKILYIFLALITLTAVVYFTILFRFKETIQYIVKKESNGAYRFDASSTTLSILKKSVHIRDAQFTCEDTTDVESHYEVHLMNAFLSIGSWRELLFKGKIIVDSLAIDLPQVKVHDHMQRQRGRVAFQFSNIFESLQKARARLEIHSLSLNKAAFSYGSQHQPATFRSNGINFSIKNFSNARNAEDKFLASDDVDLSIAEQHWQLPDGKHELTFSALHFSGKNQFFELDSCTFRGRDENDNVFAISVQKLFFNSSRLASLYDKEELVLDSVILFHPVVTIPPGKKEKEAGDTTAIISKSLRNLFSEIRVKYIDVRDGHVELSRSDTIRHAFSSYGTDFRIYKLMITGNSGHVTTDSIVLSQNRIEYITNDSLFRLTIGEFYLRGNNVLLKDAEYGPTEKNYNKKILTFKAPLLALHNVSMEDLIAKRLRAKNAELIAPVIEFTDSRKVPKRKAAPSMGIPAVKTDKFYTTLHGISELISVDKFRIQGGTLSYAASGASPLHARVEKLDMLILLNNLFSSDSLVDVKRSLPEVDMGKIAVSSPNTRLNVTDYNFKGNDHFTRAASFELKLANGSRLRGKDVSWNILDWDKFQEDKMISINQMSIKDLQVSIEATEAKKKDGAQSKDLPLIGVDRIDVTTLRVTKNGGPSQLQFNGQNIFIDTLNSVKHLLTWTNAGGLFNNVLFSNTGIKANVAKVNFNADSGISINNAEVELGSSKDNFMHIKIPSIMMGMELYSSDFSNIHFTFVELNNPLAAMIRRVVATSKSGNSNRDKKPVALTIDRVTVNNANLRYTDNSRSENLSANMKITLGLEGLRRDNQGADWLAFDKADFAISDLFYQKNLSRVAISKLSVNATTGVISRQKEKMGFKGSVSAHWSGANLQLKKPDDTGFDIEGLYGDISDNKMSISTVPNMRWQSLLKYARVGSGNVSYKGKDFSATAASFKWDAQTRNIDIGAFSTMPDLDEDEYFKKKGWQTDYLTISGKGLQVNGVHWGDQAEDSTLSIHKIFIDGVQLSATKDKRFPFKHGREKLMFTKLIKKIKYPFTVDTLALQNGAVTINEIIAKTHKKVTIPLEDINAIATHIGNVNYDHDSLRISARLGLFNVKLHALNYQEAYMDSLAGFRMYVRASEVQLPELNALTIPYAGVRVTDGHADTLYANWYGNKYAATGNMHFYYNGLRIKIVEQNDTLKSTLLQRVETAIAKDVALREKNKKPAFIYFVRDREKSVFNYWVKSLLSGTLGSAAILLSERHYKTYLKEREKYALPEVEFNQKKKGLFSR